MRERKKQTQCLSNCINGYYNYSPFLLIMATTNVCQLKKEKNIYNHLEDTNNQNSLHTFTTDLHTF